jgi:Acyl carrier protein
MEKENLIRELQEKVIAVLNLPDLAPQDLDPATALFEDTGLGLDSVDALELVVMLEKDYGVSIEDKTEAKSAFASINAMADYIISIR